jgi:hypothetical protein
MNTEIVWRLLPRYENFRLFLHRAAKDDAPPPLHSMVRVPLKE